MANNRLYILDTETNEKLLLAKTFGDRWLLRIDSEIFYNWMKDRDIVCQTSNEPSKLKLITENE